MGERGVKTRECGSHQEQPLYRRERCLQPERCLRYGVSIVRFRYAILRSSGMR